MCVDSVRMDSNNLFQVHFLQLQCQVNALVCEYKRCNVDSAVNVFGLLLEFNLVLRFTELVDVVFFIKSFIF